jgi:predicted DNA-binding protein
MIRKSKNQEAKMAGPPSRGGRPGLLLADLFAPRTEATGGGPLMYIRCSIAQEPVMARKVRKQVYIEAHQECALKRLAKKSGVTEAQIIRRALDQHLRDLESAERRKSALDRMDSFTARLIEQGPVPGGRTWRREDLYERRRP